MDSIAIRGELEVRVHYSNTRALMETAQSNECGGEASVVAKLGCGTWA